MGMALLDGPERESDEATKMLPAKLQSKKDEFRVSFLM
jgi:hypothetical protein